ncbi:MAG TPA: YbfB/YjiJ family MFS transporter [Xanthomonadales bacterium]|nr:YbfB/YjiJ family MFS transporter [Xanthomonadales bacterium]
MTLFSIHPEASNSHRDVNRPLAIVSVTALGVIGSIVFLLLPMLIGAFTETLSLRTSQVGLLGSADMMGMFIAAIVATFWIRSCNWRVIAALSCGLLVVCHLASGFTQAYLPLLTVRLLAGFAGGSLMSIALTSLGDSRHPDRFFALFVSAQLTLGGIGLWVFPGLLAQFGLGGVFTGLAAVVFCSALMIPFIPQQGRNPVVTVLKKQGLEDSDQESQGRALQPGGMTPGVMALVACFIFNMGIMMVWAYLERMGNAAGLPGDYIGRTLGLSLLAALVGALLAAGFETRFGRVMPLLVTLGVQAIALVLLATDLSRTSFMLGVMLFAFGWNFPVAYQLAITVTIDVSGRLVVLFLSAVKLGYAVAPVIAAQLFWFDMGYAPVLALAAVCFLASTIVFVALARRSNTAPL